MGKHGVYPLRDRRLDKQVHSQTGNWVPGPRKPLVQRDEASMKQQGNELGGSYW